MLLAGGFPHLEIGPDTRLLAYECILISEVITKRVPILDDIRRGLKFETHLGSSILDVAILHEEVQKLIFPEAHGFVELEDLQQLLKYDVADDDDKIHSKNLMERYLQDLDARGKSKGKGGYIL